MCMGHSVISKELHECNIISTCKLNSLRMYITDGNDLHMHPLQNLKRFLNLSMSKKKKRERDPSMLIFHSRRRHLPLAPANSPKKDVLSDKCQFLCEGAFASSLSGVLFIQKISLSIRSYHAVHIHRLVNLDLSLSSSL